MVADEDGSSGTTALSVTETTVRERLHAVWREKGQIAKRRGGELFRGMVQGESPAILLSELCLVLLQLPPLAVECLRPLTIRVPRRILP